MKCLEGGKKDGNSSLHIQHAGAIGFSVLNGKGPFLRFPFEKYGIHMSHENGKGLCHIPPFSDNGIPAFFIGYPADGKSQLFKNAGAEITHSHTAIPDADAGINGYHFLPQGDHFILMFINPLICLISCIHSIPPVTTVKAGRPAAWLSLSKIFYLPIHGRYDSPFTPRAHKVGMPAPVR